MAKANLAWAAWREGKLLEAQTNGLAALDLWRPLQVIYMFQWAALWPLIGVALAHDQLREAVDHARPLLAPHVVHTLIFSTFYLIHCSDMLLENRVVPNNHQTFTKRCMAYAINTKMKEQFIYT